MSDTQSAIKAAKEVQADTLAPELYRQSNEWFFRAKNEYKLKNFDLAKEYADKARRFAEMAEFESLKNGATRADIIAPDPLTTQAPTPYEYPTPTATPFDANPKGPDSGGSGPPTPGK